MPPHIVRVFLEVDRVKVGNDGKWWWWEVRVHTIKKPNWWVDWWTKRIPECLKMKERKDLANKDWGE
jgi:hypothetical protein